MKILECPKCNKRAIHRFSLNSIFLLSTKKRCKECQINIKLNIPILFIYLFLIPIIGIFIPIILADLYFSEDKIWLYRIVIPIGMVTLIVFINFLLGKFGKRIFLIKE